MVPVANSNNLVVSYATFKQTKGASTCYYITQAYGYELYAWIKNNFVGTMINESADIADFEASYKSSAVEVPSSDDAFLLALPATQVVEYALPAGRRCDHYTPNFCDKTTWYQDSTRVSNETLVDSGNHQVYALTTPSYVVDVTHGKIFDEDELVGDYAVVVKVNSVTKTENPVGTSDGDFSVDYITGEVTFNTALAGTETVTMSYSKVGTSLSYVRAPDGYKLRIAYIEVQFSKNIGMKDTLNFQMWGLADVFAPGQFPPGTKIPISGIETYKTINDFICDAEKAYPPIPVLTGNGGWRHPTQETLIFRFDYIDRAVTDLISDYGMEIRVWLKDDQVYEGDCAMGTFYGVKERLS